MKTFKDLQKGDLIYSFDGSTIEAHTITDISEHGYIKMAWKREPWRFKPKDLDATVDEKREYKSILSMKYTAWATDYDELKKAILKEQSVVECGNKSYKLQF